MAEKRDRRPRNEEQVELDDEVRDVGDEDDDEFEEVETEDENLDEDVVGEGEHTRKAVRG